MAAPEGGVPKGFATSHLNEQVRLAMAWNGGVSLAVWMGGVAVELDAARRKQGLYEQICNAFNRTLVIDILCGASAGGLNGALLAGAIQKPGGALKAGFLRGRWIEIGDFSLLLQPIEQTKPASLMQGNVFFSSLTKLFNDLLDSPPTAPLHSPAEVLLDVQVTDVQGEEHSFMDDWQELFYAREYRAPVRFRKVGDYTPGTLAAAARASASFPGAFESQLLNGTAADLAGFPDQQRWAVDGGLLENAPIRQAIELIPTRAASGPVKRFVCYVNADPETPPQPQDDPAQPSLAKVLAYAINLPREARMIDQLGALEDARRRAGITAAAGLELLAADAASLRVAADALLGTYRERRALRSLEELLGAPGAGSGPGLAAQVLATLERPDELPWIPSSLDTPSGPTGWRWGIRVAQRILRLELDVLMTALKDASDPEDAERVFTARARIDEGMKTLETLQRDFTDPDNGVAIEAQRLAYAKTREQTLPVLATLTQLAEGPNTIVWRYLEAGTIAFEHAIRSLSSTTARAAIPPAEALFGASAEAGYRHFVGRALAVEVVRRAFTEDLDIEAVQDLHVAQLTPKVPTPLLSAHPLGANADPGPCSPEDKLTGIRFGHFGAFYRSSWRANDFMWGRLDGAAHTVRLLVDPDRARALAARGEDPAGILAAALVPPGREAADGDRRMLVSELLGGTLDGTDPAALRTELRARIEQDLMNDDGSFTRLACTRAIQYGVLAEEAPPLVEAVAHDAASGAYDASLGWQLDGSLLPLIKQLREARGKESLPNTLGRDSGDENTSTLALRTISQAAIVTLQALTTVVPLTRTFQPARVPLFAVLGMTMRRLLDRVGVAIGFTAAAWYLAARYLTMPMPSKAHQVQLGDLWSVQTLALWVSLLAVLGVVLVPAVRVLRSGTTERKVIQGAWAAAIAAAGGGVALGWQWALNGTAIAITSKGATYAPPEALLWIVAAIGGFHVASQLESVSRPLAILHRPLGGLVSTTALLVAAVGALLAGFTMAGAIFPAATDWGWKTVCFLLALAAPVLITLYLQIWKAPLQDKPPPQ